MRERDTWCAKRTTSCLTAYREERSDERCADSVRADEAVRRAYRTLRRIGCDAKRTCNVQYAPRTGHNASHLPRIPPRYARQDTRLSMVWCALRTIYFPPYHNSRNLDSFIVRRCPLGARAPSPAPNRCHSSEVKPPSFSTLCRQRVSAGETPAYPVRVTPAMGCGRDARAPGGATPAMGAGEAPALPGGECVQ